MTPLYYPALAHFSRYISLGAVRIGFESTGENLMVTAARNPDEKYSVNRLQSRGRSERHSPTLDKKLGFRHQWKGHSNYTLIKAT
jgi:hypothetical protein